MLNNGLVVGEGVLDPHPYQNFGNFIDTKIEESSIHPLHNDKEKKSIVFFSSYYFSW